MCCITLILLRHYNIDVMLLLIVAYRVGNTTCFTLKRLLRNIVAILRQDKILITYKMIIMKRKEILIIFYIFFSFALLGERFDLET